MFTDPEQLKFSNSMPVVSLKGDRIAFVSNRSGVMRIWVSNLDGSNARQISKPEMDYHQVIKAPIEQKVPAWSPDSKWIAHWEGVEMIHLSKFTGVRDPERDQSCVKRAVGDEMPERPVRRSTAGTATGSSNVRVGLS